MRSAALLALVALLAVRAEARLVIGDAILAYWNGHGRGLIQTGTQAGKVTKIGGLDAYLALPASPKTAPAAVIMFPDVFGWEFNNTRLWADRLAAKTGYIVVLPDFFKGTQWTGNITAFLAGVPTKRVLEDYTALVAAIKKAYPSVKKIGQQGFCWGGYYTGLLSGPQSALGKAPKVDAAVAFHASLLTPAIVDAITGPVSLQQSDPKLDANLNTTLYQYINKSFSAKRAKGEVAQITSYPGMMHGYSLRGNMSDPAVSKASKTAFNEGAAFLSKYLSS